MTGQCADLRRDHRVGLPEFFEPEMTIADTGPAAWASSTATQMTQTKVNVLWAVGEKTKHLPYFDVLVLRGFECATSDARVPCIGKVERRIGPTRPDSEVARSQMVMSDDAQVRAPDQEL